MSFMFYMSHNSLIISKEVAAYLKRKPYVQEAIEKEIVNYSALSRKIAKDIGEVSFEAVKSALIRNSKQIIKEKKEREKKVIKLLNQANFYIMNKIAAIHHNSPIDIESIANSKTPSGCMYFTEESIALKSKYKKIEYGFAIIHIKNPKEIEETPGVTAFLLSTLASENINIYHIMDCREDTFLVIKEYEAPLAFKTLAESLKIS